MPTDEPVFDRGWEAIRAQARPAPARPGRKGKKGAPKRKAKSTPRKKRTHKGLRPSGKKR
jgi:hypothetical protein